MNQTKKIYLSLIIFGILSICLIVFLIYPLLTAIKKNSEEIPMQKQKLTLLNAKITNLEKFKNIYSNVEPNLKKIDTFFIDPELPIEFISFLEKTSQDCQVLTVISPTSTSKNEKDLWPALFFQLTSTGSFPNFIRFLNKLETSPYLIEIQGLTIRRLTESDLRRGEFEGLFIGDVNANLSIKVYTK